MKTLRIGAIAAIAGFMLACAAGAAQSVSGTWDLERATGTQNLKLQVSTGERSYRDHFSDTGHFTAADLGLTDSQIDGASAKAEFGLKRAAGAFTFSGVVGNGRGGGVFTFAPDDAFVQGLSSRGLKPRDDREILAAAIFDLTLPYIDSIYAAGYSHISFDNVLAFRALKVTPQSIAELRSLFGDMPADQVISASAVGVTKAYVDEMRGMGVGNITAQKAVEFKALGITRSYADSLAKLGFGRLSADQIVQFKALHIDAAYLKHLADHGLKNLTPEQVVELKATGL